MGILSTTRMSMDFISEEIKIYTSVTPVLNQSYQSINRIKRQFYKVKNIRILRKVVSFRSLKNTAKTRGHRAIIMSPYKKQYFSAPEKCSLSLFYSLCLW